MAGTLAKGSSYCHSLINSAFINGFTNQGDAGPHVASGKVRSFSESDTLDPETGTPDPSEPSRLRSRC